MKSRFPSLRRVLLKERKIQFSLATVLLAITIAIVAFGYYKWFSDDDIGPPLTPLPLHVDD
jgi:hypothetical protein